MLVPTYIKQMPETDGWGNPMQFRALDQEYWIRALGGDGRVDVARHEGPTTDFASDIIYSNGSFIEYPEGV